MFKCDYHTHTNFSFDGAKDSTPDTLCQAAIANGVTDLAITDHFECNWRAEAAYPPFDADRPELPESVTNEVEIQLKYAGYLDRQQRQVAEFKKEEARLLPSDIDYAAITGLRLEAREKLSQIRPMSLGQAGRISGVSPADIAVLMIWLEQRS